MLPIQESNAPLLDVPQWIHTFNDVTVELQQMARKLALTNFHRHALQQLRRLIAFDQAWWGKAALVNDLPEEHCSYLKGLNQGFLQDWQSIRGVDITIGMVHSQPGRAAHVQCRAPDKPAGLRWLAAKHGFDELLCIILMDSATKLSVHLSLYRQPGQASFSELDRLLLQLCMPHLVAAEGVNQIRMLMSQREMLNSFNAMAMAVCDRRGLLHSAEAGFVELLLSEWPDWTGPLLPLSCLNAQQGKRIEFTSTPVRDLYLLTARQRGPLSLLSPRETEVAQLFGEGCTHKEIARDLRMAPNTVRHHIRSIYEKLGVSSKAQIASLLRPPL